MEYNPATGLPMYGGIDTGGNTYGTDSLFNDTNTIDLGDGTYLRRHSKQGLKLGSSIIGIVIFFALAGGFAYEMRLYYGGSPLFDFSTYELIGFGAVAVAIVSLELFSFFRKKSKAAKTESIDGESVVPPFASF
jgi:hypothetical protein